MSAHGLPKMGWVAVADLYVDLDTGAMLGPDLAPLGYLPDVSRYLLRLLALHPDALLSYEDAARDENAVPAGVPARHATSLYLRQNARRLNERLERAGASGGPVEIVATRGLQVHGLCRLDGPPEAEGGAVAEDPRYAVFCAYAPADAPIMDRITDALLARGLAPYVMHLSIPPGTHAVQAVDASIDGIEHGLVAWSANAATDGEAMGHYALLVAHVRERAGRRLIPLLLDDTPLPPQLAGYRSLRLPREPAAFEDAMEDLARALRGEPPRLDPLSRLRQQYLGPREGGEA